MQNDVEQRLAGLRDNLLGGRGPGASADEVTRCTRDRALVPASPEVAVVEEQTQFARGDLPSDNDLRRGPHGPIFWLTLGAGGALLVRCLLHHVAATPPRLHHKHGQND